MLINQLQPKQDKHITEFSLVYTVLKQRRSRRLSMTSCIKVVSPCCFCMSFYKVIVHDFRNAKLKILNDSRNGDILVIFVTQIHLVVLMPQTRYDNF